MAVLEAYKLTKTYKDQAGIADVNLEVEQGAFYGVLGADGAGKTTLVRTLLNLTVPTSGGAALFGADVRRENASTRRLIGYVPAQEVLCANLTLKKYLRLSQQAYGLRDESVCLDLCQMFDLDPKMRLYDMLPDERKRASIASAMVHDPKLLILDEPSYDLDGYERSCVFAILKDLNAQGVTIFFTTQSAQEVRKFCTHAAVMGEGTVLASGRTEDIRALHTRKVSISVEEDAYEFARALSIRNFSVSGDLITFIYEDCVDVLIKRLSAFTVREFSIGEATLDTVLFGLRERSGGGDL